MGLFISSKLDLRLDRDGASGSERLALWREVMGPAGNVHVPDVDNFTGAFESRGLGELRTMRIRSGTFRYERDKTMAKRVRRDHVMVNLMERGRISGEIAGRAINAAPGEILISRLATPMNVILEDAEWLALIIPKVELDKFVFWSSSLDARVFPSQTAQAIILGGLLQSLDKLPDTLPIRETTCAVRSSLTLLAACLGRGPSPRSPAETTENDRLRSIRHFIIERLADPDLGLDLICREFEISRSRLYRMMGKSADIAAMIRRLRLQAVRRDLLSGRFSNVPVAELAGRWGLRDERNFRRAFVKEFGYPPSALRKQGQDDEPFAVVDRGTIGADLERWLLGLDNERLEDAESAGRE